MIRPPMPTTALADRMPSRPLKFEHIGYTLLHGKWWQKVPTVVAVDEVSGEIRYELREPTPWYTGGVRWRFRCTACRYHVPVLPHACEACGGQVFQPERTR